MSIETLKTTDDCPRQVQVLISTAAQEKVRAGVKTNILLDNPNGLKNNQYRQSCDQTQARLAEGIIEWVLHDD